MRLGRKLREIFTPAAAGGSAGGDARPRFSPGENHPLKSWQAEIKRLHKLGEPAAAMRLMRDAARQHGDHQEGMHYLYAQTLDRVGRHEEALAACEQELALHPNHEGALARRADAARIAGARARKISAPKARDWRSSLPHDLLMSIQRALPGFTYRGVPMQKNPFDIALYPRLLWQLKPRTLFEIGSKSGGSALWFADTLQTFGLDAHVHSLDIVRVENVSHPRITFWEGDGRNLGKTFTEEFLRALPRPWLVIEDADHVPETTMAVLKFFHEWLRPGEYIVIEDGITSDINRDAKCAGGPHAAMREFLREHVAHYEMDADYCDFYGHNLTWNTNGWLRRV